MYLIFTFREFKSIHKGKTAILHLRFGTEKNRRLGSKKARYNRAFRGRHLFCLHIMVGEGGFEPPKSLTTDLQSAPFGHSGILPYLIELLVKKWSWWTDSNPRPADYKSAALPAELHQRVSLTLEYYIIFEKICQGKSGKYFIIPLFPISAIFPAFPQHDYPTFFGTNQGHHRRFLWRDDDFGW